MKCIKYKQDTVTADPFPAPKAQDDQISIGFLARNLLIFLLLKVN